MSRPAAAAQVALSVVIPTRNRAGVLERTLRRLDETACELPVEVIVVDDGSWDETPDTIDRWLSDTSLSARVLQQPRSAGPAAARNRGLSQARGASCLFIGDDVWPGAEMIERHVDYHRTQPDPGAALLGRVVPAEPLDQSEFMIWLHDYGVQFGYARLRDGDIVDPTCFWTSNVSVKTAFIRDAGGFDEAFTGAACEDVELGLRLARRGMRLRYDADAVGAHYHPADLTRTLARMRQIGRAFRLLEERSVEVPLPTRPSWRHRGKAAALTAAAWALPRNRTTRRLAWRFLCDEVQREAFWGTGPGSGDEPLIGWRLYRLMRLSAALPGEG